LLSVENNRQMTETGKGTPMGELLRRYWHPIAAVTEFEDKSTKPVRLMGEDLVLYKDRSGTWGLLGLHCAHRRADLSYGFVEECGLRCSYQRLGLRREGQLPRPALRGHGEREQPLPRRDQAGRLPRRGEGRDALRLPRSGPRAALSHLGELHLGERLRPGRAGPLDCNWLQAAENNIDPVHFEWLHSNWSMVQAGKTGPYSPTHLKIDIDVWDYGFGYKRILEGTTEADAGWAMPRLHCMPNIFPVGGTHFEYRVPVDDTHTLSVVWAWEPVPVEQQPYVQERVPHWYHRSPTP